MRQVIRASEAQLSDEDREAMQLIGMGADEYTDRESEPGPVPRARRGPVTGRGEQQVARILRRSVRRMKPGNLPTEFVAQVLDSDRIAHGATEDLIRATKRLVASADISKPLDELITERTARLYREWRTLFAVVIAEGVLILLLLGKLTTGTV